MFYVNIFFFGVHVYICKFSDSLILTVSFVCSFEMFDLSVLDMGHCAHQKVIVSVVWTDYEQYNTVVVL